MKRGILFVGVAALIVSARAQTGELRTAGGVLRLKNFSVLTSHSDKGEITAGGQGKGLSIEDTASGLTLAADSIDCTLVKDKDGNYLLKRAVLTGDAHLTLDTAVAAQAKADRAARENLPAPPKPLTASVTEVESDAMAYAAGPDESVATFSKPVSYTDRSTGTFARTESGKTSQLAFAQTSSAQGSSAKFTFSSQLANPNAAVQQRTGHVDGPVTFTLDRTESPIGAPAAVMPKIVKVNGAGDVLDENFLGPGDPTATLSGHVTINGDGLGFAVGITGTRATVTMDPVTRGPKLYDFVGSPATTIIKTKPPTGGTP